MDIFEVRWVICVGALQLDSSVLYNRLHALVAGVLNLKRITWSNLRMRRTGTNTAVGK